MDLSTLTQQQFEELKQQIEREEKTRNFMSKLFKDMSPELLAYLLGHVPDLLPFNRFSRELVNREREQGLRVQSIRLPWKSKWVEIVKFLANHPIQHKICLHAGNDDENQFLQSPSVDNHLNYNILSLIHILKRIPNLIELHLTNFDTIMNRNIDTWTFELFPKLPKWPKFEVLHLKNSNKFLRFWMRFWMQTTEVSNNFDTLQACIMENAYLSVPIFFEFLTLVYKTLKFLTINKMEMRDPSFFPRISEGPELAITKLHLTENNFSDLLVPSLISSIKKFPHLTELDLSRNIFTEDAIEAIQQNLPPKTIFYAKDQKISSP